MKKTCRMMGIAAMVIAVAVLPALASQEAGQGGCVIGFELMAQKAFQQPLARWLNQLADMAKIQAGAALWKEGTVFQAALHMGQSEAFSLRMEGDGGDRYFSSSLLSHPVGLEPLCDWADVLEKAAEETVSLPSGGRLIPLSGEGVGRYMEKSAMAMRAWAAACRARLACQDCGACEPCRECAAAEGAALFLNMLADEFDENAFDENVLLIRIEPQPPRGDLLPVRIKDPPEAPDTLNTHLIARMAAEFIRAVAQNGETPPGGIAPAPAT